MTHMTKRRFSTSTTWPWTSATARSADRQAGAGLRKKARAACGERGRAVHHRQHAASDGLGAADRSGVRRGDPQGVGHTRRARGVGGDAGGSGGGRIGVPAVRRCADAGGGQRGASGGHDHRGRRAGRHRAGKHRGHGDDGGHHARAIG